MHSHSAPLLLTLILMATTSAACSSYDEVQLTLDSLTHAETDVSLRQQAIQAFEGLCEFVRGQNVDNKAATRVLLGRAMMLARWYGSHIVGSRPIDEANLFDALSEVISDQFTGWGLDRTDGLPGDTFVVFQGKSEPFPVLVISSDRQYYRGRAKDLIIITNGNRRSVDINKLQRRDIPKKSPTDIENERTAVLDEITSKPCRPIQELQ